MKLLRCIACFAITVAMSAQVQAGPMLSFLIDGDTFTQPFAITNSSTSGELVTRFQLNLTGTGFVFDSVTGFPPNNTLGVPFTPRFGSNVTTGLIGPVFVADGSTLLDISFTDFQPFETFSWDIDIDPFDPLASATVRGNQLIGASAVVDFSDGQRLLGVLQQVPGNLDASAFVVTGVTVTPNPVPEPVSLAIFGAMSLGLTVRGFRRRRKTSV